MKIGKSMLWVYGTLLSASLWAQKEGNRPPMLLFESYTQELGTISADDAPQAVRFPFLNQATDTLWITDVVTSCDCTTAQFATTKLAPQGRGELTLTFNPHLRSGHLFQQAFVYTNLSGSEEEAVLELTGTVTPTKDRYAGFPKQLGVLRTKRDFMRFHFTKGQKRLTEVLLCINGSSDSLQLAVASYPFLSFSTLPALILPNEEAEIEVVIDRVKWREVMGEKSELLLPIQGVGDTDAMLRIEVLFSE